MPVLESDTDIVDSSFCQEFCPQMSEPKEILKNLVYLCKQSGLHYLNDRCADQNGNNHDNRWLWASTVY